MDVKCAIIMKNDLLISISDGFGRSVVLEYEGESLVSASSSEGKVIWYDYDLEGNLKAVRDKEGTLSSYEYDDHDRLIAIFNAHGNRVFKADF